MTQTPSTSKVQIREYQPGDETRIVQLLKLVYPRYSEGVPPQDGWNWRHTDTPLKKNIIVVAESGKEIIGCDHYTYFHMKIGDKILPCTYGSYLAVHPDYRRRGINTEMRKLLWKIREENHVPFHISTAVNPIMVKHLSKLKNRFPHPITTLYWINNIKLYFERKPNQYSFVLKHGYEIVTTINKQIANINTVISPKQFKISNIDKFDEEFEPFLNQISQQYNFIIDRNIDFLNWRYCDPRGGEHITRKVLENDKIVGYSVLRIEESVEGHTFGKILDQHAIPGRLDIVDALISDAIKIFKRENVNRSSSQIIKGHPYEDVFKINGFLNSRKKEHIFYISSSIDGDIKKIVESPTSRIYFSRSDSFS